MQSAKVEEVVCALADRYLNRNVGIYKDYIKVLQDDASV